MANNLPLELIVVIDEDEDSPTNFGFAIKLLESHVYIVDPCGKLAYIIVPPHSSARHPYVKASLLSCFFDLPCGCPPTDTLSIEDLEASDYDETNENIFESESTTTPRIPLIDTDTDDIENIEDIVNNSNSVNSGITTKAEHENSQLRIIIPSLHIHYDNKTSSFWKYDEIVLSYGAQKSSYHHFHLKRGERVVELRQETNNMSSIIGNLTKADSGIFVGNRTMKDIHSIAKSDQIFMDRNGRAYKISKELLGTFEIVRINFDIEYSQSLNKISATRVHYERLNKWKDIIV